MQQPFPLRRLACEAALTVAVLLLAGCQDAPSAAGEDPSKRPSAHASAGAGASAAPRQVFKADPAESEADGQPPPHPPASEETSAFSQVPPPIRSPLDDADQHVSHTSMLVVSGAGMRLYTGYRVAQSVRLHLSSERVLADIPAIRRIDQLALRQASSRALTIPQLSESLLAMRSVQKLRDLRRHLSNPAVRSLALLLTQTVEASGKQMDDAVNAVAHATPWRRDALSRVAAQTRIVDTERVIGQQVLPYVYQSVGLPFAASSQSKLLERCDAIAVARVQLATQHLSDQDLFTLVLNLDQDRDLLGEAFGLVFDAFNSRVNDYLWAYAEAFDAAGQQSIQERLAKRS